ncbi:MAG: hypothetical protein ACYCUM_09560 [Solirubrobacteraceae bacterium]
MPDIDPLAKLVYDESVRGLDMQSQSLDEIRSRTGVLIAAATVAAALLGTSALTKHRVTYWANLSALTAFGLVVGFCLLVLWPGTKWAFAYNAGTLDDTYIKNQIDATQACRSMARGRAEHRRANARRLRWRYLWFRLACLAMLADTVLWLVSIGVR